MVHNEDNHMEYLILFYDPINHNMSAMKTDDQQLTEKSSLVTHQQEMKYSCNVTLKQLGRVAFILTTRQYMWEGNINVRNVESNLLRKFTLPHITSQYIWM